jgi:hypothetical protein
VQVGKTEPVAEAALLPLYVPKAKAFVVNVHEEDIDAVTLNVLEEVVA